MRKDPKGNQLLPRMYYRSGRYYYVRRNKWHTLARTYSDALKQYANLETPKSNWAALVDLTYQKYERRYKDGELAKNTYDQYISIKPRIVYGFGLFDPHEITTSTVTQFLDQYENTPNIANRMLSVLKAIFEKGCRSGACDFNPAHGIKRFQEAKRKRYLTDAEFRAIRHYANPQTRLIMDMCYITAQRISDVLKIEHKDISKDGVFIEQGKTGRGIQFPMTPELEAVIRGAKGIRKVMCKYLFHPKGKNTKYGYDAIRDAYWLAAKKAGVEDARLHDIRAKSLTDAKKAGIDPQKLAGHSSAAMTERYIRLRETDVISGPSLGRVLKDG